MIWTLVDSAYGLAHAAGVLAIALDIAGLPALVAGATRAKIHLAQACLKLPARHWRAAVQRKLSLEPDVSADSLREHRSFKNGRPNAYETFGAALDVLRLNYSPRVPPRIRAYSLHNPWTASLAPVRLRSATLQSHRDLPRQERHTKGSS